jgi:uncharacterized membrane protein YdbT with pleckstrin-like domain
MGNYVNSQLLQGESVVAEGKVHWIGYLGGALLMLLGLILISGTGVLGWFVFVLGIVRLVVAYIHSVTTELALTNKRVIAKFGLIRRDSVDLALPKVEGINYTQSILGRLLGYGSIVVRGTGGGGTPIPRIAAPDVFRNAVSQRLVS